MIEITRLAPLFFSIELWKHCSDVLLGFKVTPAISFLTSYGLTSLGEGWMGDGWGEGFICGVGVNGSYSCQGHKSILVGLGGWHWHLSDTSLHLPTCSVSNRLHKRELIGRWWQTSRAQLQCFGDDPFPLALELTEPCPYMRHWDHLVQQILLWVSSQSDSYMRKSTYKILYGILRFYIFWYRLGLSRY